MNTPGVDIAFAGSIPQLYEQYMVPLIFEAYAEDIALRVAHLRPASVLEIAAGTGVVTRHLAQLLPVTVPVIATDLNQPMLDQAASVGTCRPVAWQHADAVHLPFTDGAFDVVVCQFGAMFFPDKAKAFAEAKRVLRPGGRFIFNVWDRIDQNEFADLVTTSLKTLFPDDPPQFLARIPHGYHEAEMIARDLAQGGFSGTPELTTLPARSRADSAHVPAFAYCQGTPLRIEIEARDATRLAEATAVAVDAITKQFGPGPVDGKIQALVISIGC